MELKDQPAARTLGQGIGRCGSFFRPGFSPGTNQRRWSAVPEWLFKVAVARGARHYERSFDPALPPDNPSVTSEEIGIALCLEQHANRLDHFRKGTPAENAAMILVDTSVIVA